MTVAMHSDAIFDQNKSIREARPKPAVPHLVAALTSETVPWLYAALSRIHAVEGKNEVVPGVGEFDVSSLTADAARLAILALGRRDLPAPTVCPISGEGLGLTWGIGNKRVEISAYPDAEVTYTTFESGQVIATGNAIDERNGTLICNESELKATFRWLMGE